jgi:predicted dehydrogenase/nucleoside-diphosphate-sugar epimerase
VSGPATSNGTAIAELAPSAPAPRAKLRIAVIGCGAITRQLHLPALAGHEAVTVAALVDRDVARTRELARSYGVQKVLADAAELDPAQIDAAVVATPPFHHAPCSIALMRCGIHVLVEKPMATSYADAQTMVRTAEEAGVVLAVGYFRRLMPSIRMLKALLQSHWLGRPVSLDVVSGDLYTWAAATLGNMRKELAGGGVLIDFGSHMLDLVHFLFDHPAEVLEYRDNALGGIESDCLLHLRLPHCGEAVEGRVELSRTRKLGSHIRVVCERGTLEYRISERFRIWVTPHELSLTEPLQNQPRPLCLQASWADEPEVEWSQTMRAEIDDWLGAIRSGRQPSLSGRSALPTAQVIDECYRRAQPLDEPWVGEGSRSVKAAATSSANGKKRRLLLTGAAGFIGTRVAEVLALREGWDVRALVHRPASAARLARLPVEMVQGDLQSPADVQRAMEGCDAVVHCAVGTEYGNRRALHAVTVGGTRNLVAAACRANLHRFVHLSTIGIHDPNHPGTIDEGTPVAPRAGDVYAQTKAKAEQEVLRAARRGLPAVVLRPGCVYGPHGHTFVVNPLRALAEGRLVLQESADTPANTVFVDNLVEAIVRALEAPADTVRGEVFTISDGDTVTWGEYFGFFAEHLGGAVRTAPAPPPAPRRRWRPLHGLWRWYRSFVEIVTSAESKALLKKVLNTDPIARLPRLVLHGVPGLERWLRRRFGSDLAVIFRRPEPASAPAPLVVTPRRGCISIDKARKILGYEPVVRRERALELTLEWVRHAQLVN